MGSASSKATRAYPVKTGKPPSWTGSRPPAHDPKKTSPLRAVRQPWASETKDEVIEKDAKDPHLLANLTRLGPVRVDHHMQTVKTQAHVKELFQSRFRAENEASSSRTPRNRLHVSSLVALLEERQKDTITATATAAAAIRDEELAEKYGMDVERVERLVRTVNVPRVREGGGVGATAARRYIRDAESGKEVMIQEVVWREPADLKDLELSRLRRVNSA
ncbi:hypothetical protein B0F90DRAFT_1710466 [Multifurca ochricompacta]|uniref:Uncharacterized protein n=1 Tax=Multifurca ochricompacta TaxID=376703 RepID=A0AAD4M640_9AGAM|nr:hypothetical protein B0F90DRAFT_1710466 [Multifurca ochricompacta]